MQKLAHSLVILGLLCVSVLIITLISIPLHPPVSPPGWWEMVEKRKSGISAEQLEIYLDGEARGVVDMSFP